MFWYHGLYGFHGFFWPFYGFVWPVTAIIAIIPFWRICDRVGLSPWASLLILVPLANIIFVYYVAFAEWPAQRGTAGGMPPGFGSGTGSPPAGSGPGTGAGPTPN
jgi:hypothetical protein